MTSATPQPSLARRIVLLGTLMLALAVPVASVLMARIAFHAVGQDEGGYDVFMLAMGMLGITAASVGTIILWRTSGNVIGAMLIVGALVLMSSFLAWTTSAYRGATTSSTDFLGGVTGWWGTNSIIPGVFLLFPGVAILFPDGRLPGPRWRLPFAAIVVLLAVSVILQTIGPWAPDSNTVQNPFALPGVPLEVSALGGGLGALAVFLSLGLAVIAVSVRFHRSEGVERAQLKWLVASVSLMAILFPISFGTDVGPADLIDLASVVAGALIPVAIGIAILRYRLYDIDRIISRTIAYGLLTALLLGAYASIVVVLQGPLVAVTGSDTILVAPTTLVVAALFQPLRRRVQRAVDRRFDRARIDAERTSAAFSERLRDGIDIETVASDLDQTVRDALRPSTLALWLRTTGR